MHSTKRLLKTPLIGIWQRFMCCNWTRLIVLAEALKDIVFIVSSNPLKISSFLNL